MKPRKKAYRSQKINTLDGDVLLARVAGKRVIVATDVAKHDMVSSIELRDSTCVALVRWKHPHELREFVGLVSRMSEAAQDVECVQEPTGTYGDPLRVMLEKAGLPVYRVSPKHVHDLREVYDATPSSHDPKAARIIAKVHQDGMSGLWKDRAAELSAYRRSYEWFTGELQRLSGRLEGRLARHWPEVLDLLDFDSATLLRLLETYGDPRTLASHEAKARALMIATGGHFLRLEKVEAVLRSAAATVGVETTVGEAEENRFLAREAMRSKQQIKTLQAHLCEAAQDVDCVRHIRDLVGPTTAVVLYTLLGDPANYPSAGAYIKAVGLNLREQSSGKKKGQMTITKRGPGATRRLLYLAVMRLLQTEPLFALWHQRKLARSGPRQGKKSIVALSRKLVAALWHVGRGSKFEPSRLFNMVQPDATIS